MGAPTSTCTPSSKLAPDKRAMLDPNMAGTDRGGLDPRGAMSRSTDRRTDLFGLNATAKIAPLTRVYPSSFEAVSRASKPRADTRTVQSDEPTEGRCSSEAPIWL